MLFLVKPSLDAMEMPDDDDDDNDDDPVTSIISSLVDFTAAAVDPANGKSSLTLEAKQFDMST